jgi:ArsR family transcriptional regulator
MIWILKGDDSLMNQNDYVSIFKALADETRLKIVEMLAHGEMCACNILESFAISQPTLSYHMKILTESGIVKYRKDGSWMRYSNNEEVINSIKEYWNQITTTDKTRNYYKCPEDSKIGC